MEKDFEGWNKLKKLINQKETDLLFNFHKREIWWTALGVNIGKEIDGKNETFERPVLILKVINRYTLYVLPLTSRDSFTDKYHYKVNYENGGSGVVVFSQIRVISSNRLLRKLSRIDPKEFKEVKRYLVRLLG